LTSNSNSSLFRNGTRKAKKRYSWANRQ